ncbi:MAG: diguanylate cyclase [Spirochaetes bacterium]|nr:diguanylate cyclase [Spirochaetota bacterium]MBU0956395.1 diguanylate cyclase [Spirochaetota bacterium]
MYTPASPVPIRSRSGLPLLIAAVCIGATLLAMLSSWIFVRIATRNFEQRELYTRSAQFSAFLERELENMSSLGNSFAEWDDAWQFFIQPDLKFMDDTYTDAWLRQTQIDYVAMVDSGGTLAWSSLDRIEAGSNPPTLSGQLPLFGSSAKTAAGSEPRKDRSALGLLGGRSFDLSDRRLFPAAADSLDYQPIHGYLLGNNMLFMYVVWPVSNNLRTVVPNGYLIFARHMDASRTSSYLASPYIQAFFDSALPQGQNTYPVNAIVQNGELVYFQVVSDVLGRRLGAWAISLQRAWQKDAFDLLAWQLAVQLLLSLLMIYLLWLALRRRLTDPLARVCRQLDDFLVQPDEYQPLPVFSESIVTRVAVHVDQMAGRIVAQSAELSALVGNDSLTGLPNRRKLEDYAAGELRRILRRSYEQAADFHSTRHGWMAFIMMDIDYFKNYNEVYGHPAGDACLRDFARILREVIKRPSDLPGRLGGDSFGMLLPETNEKGGLVTARRIAALLQEQQLPHRSSPLQPFVSASFGVAAIMVDEHFNLELLMAMADRALLAAKDQGRNRVVGMYAHSSPGPQ